MLVEYHSLLEQKEDRSSIGRSLFNKPKWWESKIDVDRYNHHRRFLRRWKIRRSMYTNISSDRSRRYQQNMLNVCNTQVEREIVRQTNYELAEASEDFLPIVLKLNFELSPFYTPNLWWKLFGPSDEISIAVEPILWTETDEWMNEWSERETRNYVGLLVGFDGTSSCQWRWTMDREVTVSIGKFFDWARKCQTRIQSIDF